MASIFCQAKKSNFQFSIFNFQLLKEAEELQLLKKIIQFPEVLEDTASDYQVHRLSRFALELVRIFHNFYEKHRVITTDLELTKARLSLVLGTKIILEKLLDLLGIAAPEKM
jgi:arginyl-tRNA synthetase